MNTSPEKALSVIERLRALLAAHRFRLEHSLNAKAFTRRRLLPFEVVVYFVLQKSLRSLRLHLCEFFEQLTGNGLGRATAGAWTQARAKLKHTAFIELNREAVVATFYEAPSPAKLWCGRRLLAIDSSALRLPDTPAIRAENGFRQPANVKGACGAIVCDARLSVLYDCLNDLALDARLAPHSRPHLPIDYYTCMGYTRTDSDYYETIIQRHIRTGRASNKSEVIHQALALLDAVTRGNGPEDATFRNADELEALLLQAGPAIPMTVERKTRIYGSLKR